VANWDEIKADYIKRKGDVKLKDFAKEHGVKYATLRSRKNRENWDKHIVATKDATQQKSVATKKAKSRANKSKKAVEVVEGLEEAELTEKQRLFCLYYVKSFNATQAYLKAYQCSYSVANAEGYKLLVNPCIKTEIRRLKASMREELFIDGMDVLQKYVKIAFADITDYLSFNREEDIVGFDDQGKLITQEKNIIKLHNSSDVDGALISEVSQGKDGIKIKLLDKMKALEKLEKYFDLIPDKWKRKIEEEKLKLAARKAGEEDEGEEGDDGFLEALQGTVSEVWSDEEV